MLVRSATQCRTKVFTLDPRFYPADIPWYVLWIIRMWPKCKSVIGTEVHRGQPPTAEDPT